METGEFKLGNLEVYKLSVESGRLGWELYKDFDWAVKKTMGDQFIRSIDSIGANIAEGYGRYHYKDSVKFYYNARGSLLESKHWLLVLYERRIISKSEYEKVLDLLNTIHRKLNAYIKHCNKTYQQTNT